jgi:hypothetical protein
MRILIVLLVILGISGGGYAVYWNKKADEFKQMLVSSVDAINEEAKPLTKNAPLVHYDSIRATGFPFAMVLEVSKPVLDLPVSEILKQSLPNPSAAISASWVEQFSYSDTISITGNITGDHYTVTFNGDRTNRTMLDGKPRHTWISSSATPLVWHLGVEQPRGGSPWTMQPIFTDLQTFLLIFRSFDSNVENEALKDENGTPLYSFERFFISLVNEQAGGNNNKLALKINLDKGKATPAFDALYKDYMLMVYTEMGEQQMLNKIPVMLSAVGEKNSRIDITYEGPTEEKFFADPGLNVHFDINALNFQSALYNMALQAHIASIPQGSDRMISIAVHETSDATELYDQMLRQVIASVITDLASPAGKSQAETQVAHAIALLGSTPEEIAAAIAPQSHALGKTAFDLDLNIKGPVPRQEFMRKGSVSLDELNWVATPYGIKIKGSVAGNPNGIAPTGDLAFNCISCDALVNDLGGYAIRVETLVDKAYKAPKPYLTKDLLDGVKQFLHGIAEDGNAKDVLIHLAVSNAGFTISGKQLPYVQALFSNTIVPRLPQMSPSAGGQPVPMQ